MIKKLKPIGCLKTYSSDQIPASPFGINFSGDIPPSRLDDALQATLRTGVKWARVRRLYWEVVEPTPGCFDWIVADKIIDTLTAAGIKVYVQLSALGPHCTHTGRKIGDRMAALTDDPKTRRGWVNYVTQVVKRYKDRVKHWQLWNEPNLLSFWWPAPNPKEYMDLLKLTWEVVKKIDSRAKILGGNISGIDLEYAEKLLLLGGGQYMDIFVYHPYRTVPEGSRSKVKALILSDVLCSHLILDHLGDLEVVRQGYVGELKLLRGLIKKYTGRSLPVWQGECGYASDGRTIHFRGEGPWGEEMQAKWLLRRMLTDVLAGVEVTSYYALIDWQSEGIYRFYPKGINYKGLLKRETLEPKLAYNALQYLCSLLRGRATPCAISCQVDIPAGTKYADAGIELQPRHIKLAGFGKKTGKTLLAYWLPFPGVNEIYYSRINLINPAPVLRKPVLIDPLSGKVFSLQGCYHRKARRFSGIPVTDYPLFIGEQSAMSLV